MSCCKACALPLRYAPLYVMVGNLASDKQGTLPASMVPLSDFGVCSVSQVGH